MWHSKFYLKNKILQHTKNMSSALTYNKAIIIRKNMMKEQKRAQAVCAQRPKSQDCRVAWDQVEELCSTLSDCEIKRSIDIREELQAELPWEEPSKFYDV